MQKRLTFNRGDEPFPVITIGDVAARSQQKLDTIHHWVARGLGTPNPIGYAAGGALYWWPDWLEWFALRRPRVLTAMGNGPTPDSGPKRLPPCNSSLVESCADCEWTSEECDLREEVS